MGGLELGCREGRIPSLFWLGSKGQQGDIPASQGQSKCIKAIYGTHLVALRFPCSLALALSNFISLFALSCSFLSFGVIRGTISGNGLSITSTLLMDGGYMGLSVDPASSSISLSLSTLYSVSPATRPKRVL